MEITINNETLSVDAIDASGELPLIDTKDGRAFYVAESSDIAGVAVREYWLDMLKNDTENFRVLMGDETLVRWCLGQKGGWGKVKANTLDQWMDLQACNPAKHFALYDGEEQEATADDELSDALGFTPTVAYRCDRGPVDMFRRCWG